MIIVPIAGDKIKRASGLPAKVLSYTNTELEGPAVLVQGPDQSSETVFFQDISMINDQKVKFVKNADAYKVFEIHGVMSRTFHLPQPGDSVRADSGDTSREYEIQRIRLHVKDEQAKGLIFDVFQPGTEELIEEITIDQITDIDHSLFNRTKFLAYYADYAKKGAV